MHHRVQETQLAQMLSLRSEPSLRRRMERANPPGKPRSNRQAAAPLCKRKPDKPVCHRRRYPLGSLINYPVHPPLDSRRESRLTCAMVMPPCKDH
jgi:hypothetical protein